MSDISKHHKIIQSIIKEVIDQDVVDTTRMTAGISNEVYSVKLSDKEVIVRLNLDESKMQGSQKYLPLFKSLGIVVPEIKKISKKNRKILKNFL